MSFLLGGLGFTPARRLAGSVPALPSSNLKSILAIGHSEVAGVGGNGYTFPQGMANSLYRDGSGSVFNAGKAGWTPTDIAILHGARDVTLSGFTLQPGGWSSAMVTPSFADGGPVSFRNVPASWQGMLTWPGGSRAGQLQRSWDGSSWNFGAAGVTEAQVIPGGAVFHCPEYDSFRDHTFFVMLGRNADFTDPVQRAAVLFDTAAVIARQTSTGQGYLVFGELPGVVDLQNGGAALEGLIEVNQALAQAYGDRFIDTRAWLMANGLAFMGLFPTAQDTADIAAGILPRSLYDPGDLFHPNAGGYAGMAEAGRQKWQALGWSKTGPVPKVLADYPSTAVRAIASNASPPFFLRMDGNYGTAARGAAGSRTGSNGLRATFSGTGTGAMLEMYSNALDPGQAMAAKVWVRPSEPVTLALAVVGYGENYDLAPPPLATIQGQGVNCPANVWTLLCVSIGTQRAAFHGTATAFSVRNDGITWNAGNTLDMADLEVVLGSALP